MTIQQYHQVKNSRMLSVMNRKWREDLISIEIERACQLLSFDCDVAVLAGEFVSYLERFHSYMREGEVEILFQEGTYEKFGKIYGMNFRTLLHWAVSYKLERGKVISMINDPSFNMQEKAKFIVDNLDKLPLTKKALEDNNSAFKLIK